MYFAVNHKIHEPKAFWAIQKKLPKAPKGIFIHAVFPNKAMDEAVVIWRANQREDLIFYLETYVSEHARSVFLTIDETKAIGLYRK